MSRTDAPRLAILGAGPVGLEAALYAAALNLPFRVYERGKVGDNLRRWGHVKLFTPFGLNSTALGRAALRDQKLPADADLLTGRDHVATYLEPLAKSAQLAGKIEADTTVLGIGRKGYLKGEKSGDPRRGQQPFRLLLRDAKGQERVAEADVVLDCTGTYGHGRHLGDGGIPAVGELAARAHIASGLEDVLGEKASHYADRTTLVVGGGHTAATTVCLLASLAKKHPSTWVIWLARNAGSQPIRRVMGDPLRERDLVASKANTLATRGEGHVEFFPGAVVEGVEHAGKEGFLVTARVGDATRTWEVERVIANVGYDPDNRIYRELQVQECYASLGPQAMKHPEPNFYILGMKSHGRSSNFLVREGFEQVREVFTLIAGKADLDLDPPSR